MKFIYFFIFLFVSCSSITTKKMPLKKRSPQSIIKDNRLYELGTTPTVGRGYSMATNQFQGVCFEKIIMTKPSYNFQYSFEEVDLTQLNQLAHSHKMEDIFLSGFLNKHVTFEGKKRDNSGMSVKTKIINILVHIDSDSYYHSLDESKSNLSTSSIDLLREGRYTDFFSTCGFHYVRNLGRQSSFFALLQFNSVDSEEDDYFKKEIEKTLVGLTSIKEEDEQNSIEFSKQISNRHLKIFIEAVGLRGVKGLTPTSLRSFRQTIRKASKMMDGAETGKVTSMEVIPWTDNIKFRSIVATNGEHSLSKMREIRNTQDNAALMAQVERIDNFQRDLYYRGKNCLRILDEEYPIGKGAHGYHPDKTWFYNLNNPLNTKAYKTLREMNKFINPKTVEALYNENEEFLYGKEGKKGAYDCIDELEEKGVKKISYRRIKSCRDIPRYRLKHFQFVNQYCLPRKVDYIREDHPFKKDLRKITPKDEPSNNDEFEGYDGDWEIEYFQ